MRQYTDPNSNPKHATPPEGGGNREPFPPPPAVLEDHPFIRIPSTRASARAILVLPNE